MNIGISRVLKTVWSWLYDEGILLLQKLSNAQLWFPLLLSEQNSNWMQNTGVWFLWSSRVSSAEES